MTTAPKIKEGDAHCSSADGKVYVFKDGQWWTTDLPDCRSSYPHWPDLASLTLAPVSPVTTTQSPD